MDLKGKCALVTGGATGIGLCYVRHLLKNGVQKCAILDMNATMGDDSCKKLNTEYGKDRVMFIKCDVTKMTEFENAFMTVMGSYKNIDILINNAGMMNDGEWEKEILLNVNSVVMGTMLGMKYMGKDNGGRGGAIVNIASILGLSPLAGCPVYCGTKHAVVGLTRSWAMPYYYEKCGIRMMVMCPGVTDTDLISGAGKRQMGSEMSKECHRELSALPKQDPENVAMGMMNMLTRGDNGSVWVSEGGQPIYEVMIPERMNMRKMC